MKGLITICLLAVSMSAVADRYRTPNYGGDASAYGGTAKAYGGAGYGGTGYGGTGTGIAQQGQTLNSTNTLSGTQSLSGSQSQTGTVTGSQESSNNGVSIEGDDYKRPTPPAFAPAMMTTTSCIIGVSGGGAVPSFAISIGGYIVDKECMIDRDLGTFAWAEVTGRAPHIDLEFYHRVLCEKERYQTAMQGRGGMECYPVNAPPVRVIPATYNTCHVADIDDCDDSPEATSRKKAKGWGGMLK